jgi:hypothetical protein
MVTGNSIRGSRVGAGPARWDERGEQVRTQTVSYWCASGHRTDPAFAAGVEIPETWECPHCGGPAGPDRANPPSRQRAEPYKTHLAYVKERRSDEEAAAILAEALAKLRQRRA